jgi:tetratricopeptide (TPR) repeat protein
VIAVASGYGALRQVHRQLAAARVCALVGAERWEEAIALSSSSPEADEEGRITAECRCSALLATGRDAECVELLEGLLSEPESDGWLPDPRLAALVIRARRDRGELVGAAALAQRAAAAHPADRDLLQLELLTRGLVEGEESVLDDLERRLGGGNGPLLSLRLVLSHARHRRGELDEALEVLGDRPPSADDPELPEWFEARARAFASLRRLDDVARTYEEWIARGGEPAEIRARYALRLSQSGLEDPQASVIELLRGAMATQDRIASPSIREALYHRLIGHLLVSGRTAEALEVYDEGRKRFELRGLSRDQILRSATLEPRAAAEEPSGVVVFRMPDGVEGRLLVSPGPRAPPDGVYEELAVHRGREVRVRRAPSILPERWVLRDPEGQAIASGAVWPPPGETVAITIEPRSTSLERRPVSPPRAGDGRRRVFVVIPDCGDWRLLRYLVARGELPLIGHLLEEGYRAVLESTPPLTAAAMESLVWPERGGETTFVAIAHRLGLELAGLASIGRNPLGFLSALLPDAPGLMETIGRGNLVAANMLFAHGAIDAGRHAEIIGPRGERRSARAVRSLRPLRSEEAQRFPALRGEPKFLPLVETIAAQLDTALDLAREREVDLLLLRLEAFDILTHAHFDELTRAGQDDGSPFLLSIYRYVDWRLQALYEALDADDVLIVMSDHGIRTPMEHSEDAVFLAIGVGVPRGRAEGTPHFRGVARALADLLGVETAWPDTGVAPWARARARGSRAP